jgi:hypothetical protein
MIRVEIRRHRFLMWRGASDESLIFPFRPSRVFSQSVLLPLNFWIHLSGTLSKPSLEVRLQARILRQSIQVSRPAFLLFR